jgi:mitochondrial fission protein ELM1
LQNPKINSDYFDLVIPPYHDNLKGKNVIPTLGALHPIKPEELVALRQKLENDGSYNALKTPRIAVLLGGDNKYYRYTNQVH